MLPRLKLLLSLCLLATFLASSAVVPTHAETFRNPRCIPLSVDPYGVTTGDLNGDGRNDIVWLESPISSSSNLVHVLLANANGQYLSAPDLTLPFHPTAIHCILEDVTGDQHLDLVCASVASNYTDLSLITYPGKGDGTFASPVQMRALTQTGFVPILARAGDLNGDGIPDVLLMNAYGGGILPYLSDAHGGFRAAPSFPGSFNYSVPTLTDLSGDGKLDVLWPTGPRVNLGNGDGTFSLPVHYDPGLDSNCAFGDVDHDGHLDAACTWYDNGDADGYIHLTMLHGNSDGSFNPTPLFTRTFGNGENDYDGISTILAPVLVADLNGDGLADIVSRSGDGYCVLLGGANITWNGPPQQFVTASFQAQEELSGYYGISIADINGDGLPDIVAIGPNGLYLTYAQRDGTLSSAPAPEVGQVSTSATLIDVNGDGNLDVVSAGDTALKLSLGRGDGTFSAPQPIPSTDNFGRVNYIAPSILSGDFNGDGKQDLLATGSVAAYTSQAYILFGHGDGTFDAPKPTPVSLGKIADLNTDGRSDVISIQNNASSANLLIASLSRGDGTFTTVSTNLPAEFVFGSFAFASAGPALADFGHSGHLDVATASYNHAYVLPGHGDGTFNASVSPLALPDLPGLTKVGARDVAAGDFDHDGNPDLAVLVQYNTGTYSISSSSSAVWVFYGKGDGTFSSAVLAGTFNRTAETLTAGDLDGDGLSDLVLTSFDYYYDNGLLVVHALPNRTWGPETDYTGGYGLSPLWITDINHDGRNDLIVANGLQLNGLTNSIAVLLNEPPTSLTGSITAAPEPSNVTYPFTLNATLFPSNAADTLSGTVTFSLDGTVVGSAALTGNAASFTLSGTSIPAGIHTLSATWPGNSTYPAVTLTGSHTVSFLPLNITLSATPVSLVVGGTVNASATLTPAVALNQAGYQLPGLLTLYDNGVAIAQQPVSQSSFTLSSLAVGTHMLSVSYPGDPFFSPAQSNSVNVTVTAPPVVSPSDFSIALSPAIITLSPGATGTVAVQLKSIGSFAGPLALTYGALPTYATASLSQPSVPLTGGGTGSSMLTLNTLLKTANTVRPQSVRTRLPVAFAALLLVFLPSKWTRRSKLSRLLFVALLGITLHVISGCTNAFYIGNTVASGTYQLPVTATDINHTSHTATLTVIVNQ